MGKVSEHFSDTEVKCPCCGAMSMNGEFLQKLDNIRNKVNRPIILTSAFRCIDHNRKVGGKDNSAHVTGHAADIRVVSGREKFEVVQAAVEAGINRIGIGTDFVHVDDDPALPHTVIWTY